MLGIGMLAIVMNLLIFTELAQPFQSQFVDSPGPFWHCTHVNIGTKIEGTYSMAEKWFPSGCYCCSHSIIDHHVMRHSIDIFGVVMYVQGH